MDEVGKIIERIWPKVPADSLAKVSKHLKYSRELGLDIERFSMYELSVLSVNPIEAESADEYKRKASKQHEVRALVGEVLDWTPEQLQKWAFTVSRRISSARVLEPLLVRGKGDKALCVAGMALQQWKGLPKLVDAHPELFTQEILNKTVGWINKSGWGEGCKARAISSVESIRADLYKAKDAEEILDSGKITANGAMRILEALIPSWVGLSTDLEIIGSCLAILKEEEHDEFLASWIASIMPPRHLDPSEQVCKNQRLIVQKIYATHPKIIKVLKEEMIQNVIELSIYGNSAFLEDMIGYGLTERKGGKKGLWTKAIRRAVEKKQEQAATVEDWDNLKRTLEILDPISKAPKGKELEKYLNETYSYFIHNDLLIRLTKHYNTDLETVAKNEVMESEVELS